MPVAKSFQNFKTLTEPFAVGGKEYIKVQNPKTGAIRQVRWYNEKEFAKLYPEVKVKVEKKGTQKEALGFNKGYITIFKGPIEKYEDWFSASIARYARWWGWYIVSTEEIPSDLPNEIIPIKLPWESVGNYDGELIRERDVKSAVDALLYDEVQSQWIGEPGNRIELTVKVINTIPIETNYGTHSMYIMEDKKGNSLTWTTSSTKLNKSYQGKIRATIKEHYLYKNKKTTSVIRCTEVK